METLERNYCDILASADSFADFAQLEDKGLSATKCGPDSRHTYFSASGHVATLCGIPVFPRGLNDPKKIKTAEDSVRQGLVDFFPGVTRLGDILRDQGYDTTYINGADTELFAIAEPMRSHGFATVRGLKTEPEHADAPSNNTWGCLMPNCSRLAPKSWTALLPTIAPSRLFFSHHKPTGPTVIWIRAGTYAPSVKPGQA